MESPAVLFCEHAWLGGDTHGIADGVVIRIDRGRIAEIRTGVAAPPAGALPLAGVTIPGMANAHSHAFHRALRGRTEQSGDGSFWSWREQMYALAATIDPDQQYALARAVFAEMLLAGVTCVGEFHYLHHAPGGRLYPAPNAMGEATVVAAHDAGIRLTLIDTCYLHGGIEGGRPLPPDDVQQRFSDRSPQAWAARLDLLGAALEDWPLTRLAAGAHSVRALDPGALAAVAGWARQRSVPCHVHLSEQPAENAQCAAAYGMTPTALCDAAGLLGERTTAVHGTHLTLDDAARLAASGTTVCLCPTTERDLADGIGPSAMLAARHVPIALGTDSNSVVDVFEEARAVELDQRLASLRRGTHGPHALARMATVNGYRSLGWPDGGVLRPGAHADLTTFRLDSPRLAGTDPAAALGSLVFAAGAADVTHVVVDGRLVVDDGEHVKLDAGRELDAAIRDVTGRR